MSAAPEVFSGPLGEELLRRLEGTVAEARELLGLPDPETPARTCSISMRSGP